MDYSDKIQLCTTSPSDFINRYCSKLHISIELTKLCEFIAFLVKKNNIIPENTPHSIAAGIIYLVISTFDLNINKRDLQKICDISEVTITKCFKKLEERKHQLIPPTILKKYNIGGTYKQVPPSPLLKLIKINKLKKIKCKLIKKINKLKNQINKLIKINKLKKIK